MSGMLMLMRNGKSGWLDVNVTYLMVAYGDVDFCLFVCLFKKQVLFKFENLSTAVRKLP